MEQAQGGTGHAGGTHTTVLIKAQEQLLQPAGDDTKVGQESFGCLSTLEVQITSLCVQPHTMHAVDKS